MNGKRMVPGAEIIVRSANSRSETKLVLLVAILTIVLCGSVIAQRRTVTGVVEMPAWQVNAFQDLRATELATFNALNSASPEIEAFHDEDRHWPTIVELRGDYIPPFVQDAAWQKNGRLRWRRSILSVGKKHIALYFGKPERQGVSGSFLLVMLHDHVKKNVNVGGATHAPYEVWLHSSAKVLMPKMMTDQALISVGWREVVARKGEDEVRRTKDEAYLKW